MVKVTEATLTYVAIDGAGRAACRAWPAAPARLLLDATYARRWSRALAMVAAVVGGIGGFGTGIILTAALAPLIGVKA